jgi:hypothetical protein
VVAVDSALVKMSDMTDQERARALARFRSLRGRGGVQVRFHPVGPAVPAQSPQELQEAADQALVGEALEQEPS